MKLVAIGVVSLFCLSACGSEVIVGDQGGGSSGLSSSGGPGLPGAGSGGSNPGSGPSNLSDCSASPASFEDYTSSEELNGLLIGRWQRCLAPQLPGEDIGVEFTDDGKFYPLTSDATGQVVRRTGVDYEGTWSYSPPGSEDLISHQASAKGFMQLNGVITSPPDFTNDPRQLRILFSPALSKYVPLLP